MALISSVLVLISAATLLLMLGLKFLRFIRWFKQLHSIPGVAGYSIFGGNLGQVPKGGEERITFHRDFMDKDPACRKLLRFWYGPLLPLINVYHPDVMKPMFKASIARKPNRMGASLQLIRPFIGDGLLTTSLDTWHRNRKLITPAFHFNVLRSYCSIFNEATDILLSKLEKEAEQSKTIDFIQPIGLCVLQGILRCAMSYEEDVQRNRTHPYPMTVAEILEFWTERVRSVWMWPDFVLKLTPKGRRFLARCKYTHDLADSIIKERRQLIKEEECVFANRTKDFVDMLMDACDEDGEGLTDREIRDEVNTFMVAGQHTTSTAIPWLLYLLAKNPEYQRRVQKEIDQLLEGRESQHLDWDDLSKLTTLTLCAKESLRLYPPVPAVQRELIKDIELDGYPIPKGTIIVALLNNLHRHPDVWERPDDFYPERFLLDEGNKVYDTYAHIPFAAGPRNCIGQNFAITELKVIVSRLLHQFNLELDPKAPPITRAGLLLLKAEHGIWLKITKRENTSDTAATPRAATTTATASI